MPEVIQSIVLSSGTVVTIPSFPRHERLSPPADKITIYTRANCALMHYSGSVRKWQRFSDDDLVELGNILTGADCKTLVVDTPAITGQYVGSLFWYWDTINYPSGGWSLAIEFSPSGDNMQLGLTNYWPVGGGNRYFNGENPQGTDEQERDFYYAVANAPTALGWTFKNYREGSLYSLDIATNFDLNPGLNYLLANTIFTNVQSYLTQHPDADITIIGYDPESEDDPYVIDDPATLGGGTGARENPEDIEKAEIPDLPSLSAVDTGLITMYGATLAQLQSLGAYLWSDLWDIENNFKKLFSDPMNCLIGLSIVPVRPSMGGAANVKFGNITTNVALNKLTSQYAEVDCGTVSIKEYIGSFLDYSPYVNISIYLPYIGYRELSPDDVMNDSVHVVYHIDVLTGGCCAMIETGNKGLLYSFNGSCIANVPITAINYSGAIQNAVSAVGAGVTTAVGIATGAAPIAAMGAASMLSNAANTAMNSKPTVQRSGNMGGSAGLMSYQKPMLVITRPRQSVPSKLNKFTGLTTNVTLKLSQTKGFTQVELIHLDGIPCMDEERKELLSLLKEGVIF